MLRNVAYVTHTTNIHLSLGTQQLTRQLLRTAVGCPMTIVQALLIMPWQCNRGLSTAVRAAYTGY